MKKKEKIMIALSIVMFAAAIAIFILSPFAPEELTVEDFRVVETESLDLVGTGTEITDIENDIRIVNEQLESISKELFDGLDAELQQL